MRTLVVYYSRSGNTRKIAEDISNALGCNIEELIDTQDRSGALGYMRSVIHAIRKTPAVLDDIKNDPSAYDLVVIGTPVWNMKLSTPVRTYLVGNQVKFNNVALFCTASGPKFDGCVQEIKDILGIAPLASLGVRGKEIKDESYQSKINEFIKEIQQ